MLPDVSFLYAEREPGTFALREFRSAGFHVTREGIEIELPGELPELRATVLRSDRFDALPVEEHEGVVEGLELVRGRLGVHACLS